LINIHIRRSRIRRRQHDYDGAFDEAELAITMAESREMIVAGADAYISRGEAHFSFAEEHARPSTPFYIAARKDFETARSLVVKKNSKNGNERILNPKVASVCELRIAQCYAREGNQIKANGWFEKWKTQHATVQHQWVRDLATEVEQDIRKLDDFFSISSRNTAEWNYHRQVDRLREWLYAQAMRQANNDEQKAAKLLGVTRSAIFNWRQGSKFARAKRSKQRSPRVS